MHLLFGIVLLLVGALASPALIPRTADACQKSLIEFSAQAIPFCSVWGEAVLTDDILLELIELIENPEFLIACLGETSEISSACSVLTCTSTSKKSSTHSSTKSSTIVTLTSSSSFVPTSTSSLPVSTSSTSVLPSSTSTSSTSELPSTSSTSVALPSSSSSTSSTSSSEISTSSTSSSSAPSSTLSSAVPSSTSSSSSISTESSSSPTTTSISSSSSESSSVPTSSSSTSSSSPSSSTSSEPSSAPTSSSVPSSTLSAYPNARTSPAAGAIVVDASNTTAGSYITVSQGVAALSLTSTTPQNLFIYPGSYFEQVYIPALKSNLTVQGYTEDATSYESNEATVTYNLALLDTTSDDLTATIRQWNENTKFYNLNIVNTFGHVSTNGQNLALSAHTGNQGYYGVQLIGYQDTLLSNTGNQLYAKCLIVGAVDFIFGQTATAWFDQVDIRTIATGCVTASGRASASNPSWYVINNSTVDGINSTIAAGINYLGRPWESFARVVFQYTYLGAIINPAGWRVWSTAVNGTTNIGNVTFAEYDNYGPGSILEEGPRANFSEQLNSSITIESILGDAWEDEWWVDLSYMPYAT